MKKVPNLVKKFRIIEILAGIMAIAVLSMYIANNFINRTNLQADLDRRKNIDAQYYALNNFYASNNYFPATEDFSNKAWLSDNLLNQTGDDRGVSEGDFAGSNDYKYISKLNSEDCIEEGLKCNSFLLSTELSDGTPYILVSE